MNTASEVRAEHAPGSAAMEREHGPSPATRIWNLLISIRFAIWILILLAGTSMVGTLIEQNRPTDESLRIYGERTYHLLASLQLFDMYHSWWFLLLLCLFTLNLTCCTIDRLPRAVRAVRNRRLKLTEALEKTLPLSERWKDKGDLRAGAEAYRSALGRAFAAPRVTEAGGAVHLYAEKGAYGRLGAYVTHAGIIVIFVGAIVGNVFGFKSYVAIPDGQTTSHLEVRRGTKTIDLPFSIRNNKFSMETYPNGQPSRYASDLSVIENGREVLRKTIEVNDPLVYKGVWFYQASYGQASDPVARVRVRKASGQDAGTLDLLANETRTIPGYGTIRAVNYDPNYLGFGPALQVVVKKPGKGARALWLFQRYPAFDRQRGDAYYFGFLKLDETFYTGLQVARDPGVNVVWLGCLLLTGGMLMSFFLSHRRIWIRVAPGAAGRIEVTAAGSANRNRLAFEKSFAEVVAKVRRDPSNTEKENHA